MSYFLFLAPRLAINYLQALKSSEESLREQVQNRIFHFSLQNDSLSIDQGSLIPFTVLLIISLKKQRKRKLHSLLLLQNGNKRQQS